MLVDTKSWLEFTPRDTWVLIKTDPRVKQTKGGIFLTEEYTLMERLGMSTGRVLKIGPKVTDIKPGMRVCFRGFLKDVFWDVFSPDEDGLRICLLKEYDILLEIDENVRIGA